MGMLFLLLLVVVLLGPLFLLGLFRKWLIAGPIWAALALYATFQWLAATPVEWDQQDLMGHQAWELILAILVGGGAVAFVAGFGVSIARSRSRPNNAQEVRE